MAGTVQKTEMSRDHAQRIAALEFQFGDQSPPWLEPRKLHLLDIAHQAFAKEDDIAMPAMGPREAGDRPRQKPGLPLQPAAIKEAATLADPGIGFLERHDVG